MAQNRYFWAMLGLGNLEEYFWKLQNEHFRGSAWNADNEIQGEIIKRIWKHVACGMSVKNRKKCANRFRILLQKCVGKSGSGPPKPQNEAVEAAPKLRKCRKWASGAPNWAQCFRPNLKKKRVRTLHIMGVAMVGDHILAHSYKDVLLIVSITCFSFHHSSISFLSSESWI